ncbi:YicC family protein [Dissulfurirhabdus thermomarina]|uniref:YicC family protein n=1 Tax=Dissulfurirhabdus thermomarina TaxID=1765737 RepID=A0A6N9TQC6_DISTH|nr:YicC/YloC family endoribonuclease [Dissulfurirhabdus thermomarina]NDY41637.1 YicC family protein [Dissulfurirhabdus thermomarina]NMX23320.1 YicC family protein [Dissulfurirhabdus thermomarina]
MTTYARARSEGAAVEVDMELRSVNGRYCDVQVRLPRWLLPFEDRVRKRVQAALGRGRVDVTVQVGGAALAGPEFVPNTGLVQAYLRAAGALAEECGLAGGLELRDVLGILKDAVEAREAEPDAEAAWPVVAEALERLLAEAQEAARREGEALKADLDLRLDRVEAWLEAIDRRRRDHLRAAQEALRERVERHLAETRLDPARIAQEAAFLADRLDITEEVVRARSHLAQFRELLASDEPVGRRLDFLLQELFREVNTMASKSADAEISRLVVDIKGEQEKMREQVQNLV